MWAVVAVGALEGFQRNETGDRLATSLDPLTTCGSPPTRSLPCLRRSLGDLTPLRHRLQELMVTNGGPPRVVAYCNTGQRSAAASILLTEKMGMPVGGLVLMACWEPAWGLPLPPAWLVRSCSTNGT